MKRSMYVFLAFVGVAIIGVAVAADGLMRGLGAFYGLLVCLPSMFLFAYHKDCKSCELRKAKD